MMACTAAQPSPAPVTAPAVLPTATPAVSATAPVLTRQPPPSPSAVPSNVPIPTSVPEPTTSPVSPTPEGRLGPDNFPPGINPLTGLPADPQALAQPPLNIKVSNAPPCVRPQDGLAQADVIFEHYLEAWATRFTAVFHSQLPTRVGSVRSARQIDLELPAIFGSGFVFSGASAGNQRLLDASDFAERTLHALDACPMVCRVPKETVLCNDSIHTLFANAQAAQAEFARRGHTRALFPLEGWAFADQPPTAGEPATRIDVNYLNAPVRWRYRAEAGRYFRYQTGVAHTDAATGQTLSASNVVVLYAPQVYSDIQESTLWYSLQIQFWGTGPALIFRDGQAFGATWVRQNRQRLFTLVDEANNVLPLRPGQTWFEFVGVGSITTHTEGQWTIDPDELPLQTPPQRK